ncbi:MAG: ATP-dependent DNA helicase RecG, partial [Clostridiales Family XIII bacterium]|nr:ATP-dependent DNA helicase RecG [Clostridiales Family XIII bacterium]
LPSDILTEQRLAGRDFAYKNIHYPSSNNAYLAAKYRLIFDEFFILKASILFKNKDEVVKRGISFDEVFNVSDFIKMVPFELTNAQKRVIDEINKDMENPKMMNRLLQGDVGSGKTVMAAFAIFKAYKNGYQSAFLAPTQILAKQHFENLKRFFKDSIKISLITSEIKGTKRKTLLDDLKNGNINLLIGTTALISEGLEYKNLGLIIIDEQHKFGVRQKTNLTKKGKSLDILTMSATPIPRTLASMLYGNLNISRLDELPKGRQKIITRVIEQKEKQKAYDFAFEKIKEGRQVYIVAPFIEESDFSNEKNIMTVKQIFDELKIKKINDKDKIGLLHGRMNDDEKNKIMQDFLAKKIMLLVSTSLIEVGIDVKNASLMIIESAGRFSLSSLHQLRGRIGRGEDKSYCVLISDLKSELAKERLKIMQDTSDGFIISEKDLELRGPGDFIGVIQSGFINFKLADFARDRKIFKKANDLADRLFSKKDIIKDMVKLKFVIEERIYGSY